jgi:hypothetical protein
MWALLSALISPITSLLGIAINGLTKWREGQQQIAAAKVEATVSEYKAKAELAAYKAKADLEWDLTWAQQAQSSWKDEALLLLWALPTILLFVPGPLRASVMDGFEYLKAFNEDAPTMFMAGWAVIFSATFGMKQAMAFMLPKKAAALAQAFGTIDPDVPMEVAAQVQTNLNAARTAR